MIDPVPPTVPRMTLPAPPPVLLATSKPALPLSVVAPKVNVYGLVVASALVAESLALMLSGPKTALSEPVTSMPESALTVTLLV